MPRYCAINIVFLQENSSGADKCRRPCSSCDWRLGLDAPWSTQLREFALPTQELPDFVEAASYEKEAEERVDFTVPLFSAAATAYSVLQPRMVR